ncbi:SGNH/GDSL hydrolase family protein [Arthrobacter sp. D3-16]
MKLGGILSLTVAILLTGCAPAVLEGDPNISVKAQAYEAKVKAKLQAQAEAADEAKLVRLTFPADRPLRVLFAGDSLTGGFFASTKDRAFTELMKQSLAQKGPIEEARGEQAHATLSTVGGLVEVPAGLDLAVVELGTNDVGAKTEPTAFASQYAGLLEKIQAESPNVKILCASVWQSEGTSMDVYNRAIQEQCEHAGGKYANISTLYGAAGHRGPEGLETWIGTSDTFHPNDIGHKAIANLLLERIKVS